MELVRLGIAAEAAGFDGFFLWDHIVFSNTGEGPPIVDPWLVLAVVAASTSRIRIGTMITPVPRRRPWQLAKETTTLDLLSNGRLILGVGIGSPAYGDFGILGEPSGERERAELLDEGLAVMAGLWSGEKFSYRGKHFQAGPGAGSARRRCSGPGSRSGSAACCPTGGRSSGRSGGTAWCRSGTPTGSWPPRRRRTWPISARPRRRRAGRRTGSTWWCGPRWLTTRRRWRSGRRRTWRPGRPGGSRPRVPEPGWWEGAQARVAAGV